MKRGGGRAGRPLKTWSIDQLESYVRRHEYDLHELKVVMVELGYRSNQRAKELGELVARLIRNPEPRGLL